MLQFVCMGGTPERMKDFAYYIMEEIGHKLPTGTMLQDISQKSYRYSMYKVGPVLCISVSIHYCPRLTRTALNMRVERVPCAQANLQALFQSLISIIASVPFHWASFVKCSV